MAAFSDLTAALDSLSEHGQNLFKAYENDDDVGDLKARAIEIRDKAQRLIDALDGVNEGLGQL